MVPEYKKLGEIIAANPKLASRVVIAKVNADAHSSIGQRFGVRGFPTLKVGQRSWSFIFLLQLTGKVASAACWVVGPACAVAGGEWQGCWLLRRRRLSGLAAHCFGNIC